MNRQRYRLVFNTRQGGLVAVAEHARGRGKSATGAGVRSAGALLGALVGGLMLSLPAMAELPVPSAGGNIPGFVTAGQVGYVINGNQALINQVGNKAILNWQRFNIGAGQSVQFRQVDSLANPQLVQGANFTSLNRIWDINPSVIAGNIGQAAGQNANVILVNSNGIAFMGGSQVNLNSFTASTLNMADRFVLDRLLGDNLFPQFERSLDGGEARGFVKVFEGANLSATSQGRVMLIAPTVVNRGNISAPDGQVILAAGTRAFLRSDDNEDLNLRGLLVEVDSAAGLSGFATANDSVRDGELDGQPVSLTNAVDDLLGHATNTGTLSTPRGNVTMVGYAVNQLGLASATSSVVANGSVYLMAKDTKAGVAANIGSSRGGQVTLGAGSRTEVLPDVQDATTTVDGDTGVGQAAASQIRVLGQTVTLKSGSVIQAPSGDVVLTAVDDPQTVRINGDIEGVLTPSGAARLHIEQGTRVDVAGLAGVNVSAARNTVEVELRGDELKDSPVNRNGPLRGEKAFVDIEQAIANADAGKNTLIARDSLENYRGQLQRGIAERSTAGGQVTLRSQGQTVVEQGAVFDLSGGSVAFQQGVAKTTVLSANGQLVDLADANADTRYDAIVSRFEVDYGRWNEREVIELPSARRVVQGYTEGKDAGSLNLQSAGAAYFQGEVQGRTVVGDRQLLSGQAPRGARFTVGAEATGDFRLNQQVVLTRERPDLPRDFSSGNLLSPTQNTTLSIDAELLGKDRVADLTVFSNQAAVVRDALRAAPGGSVRITAPEITVKANVDAPGGHIVLDARSANLGGRDSQVRVDNGVQLTARGSFVNRLPGAGVSPNGALPPVDGGSITVTAQSTASGSTVGEYLSRGTVALGQGVVLDASAGVVMEADGSARYGEGGDLTVRGFNVTGLGNTSLLAEGFGAGGSLTIGAGNVQIGGSASATAADTLQLDPRFFTQGGFAQYNVSALDRLVVAQGTALAPVVRERELLPLAPALPTGSAIADVSRTVVRDAVEREGASLSLTANGGTAGTGALVIERGARVEVDPGERVALNARNQILVEGAVVARGGEITANLNKPATELGAAPDANTLWLGSQALLDVSGTVQTFQDTQGRLQGEVRTGGRVNLRAQTGSLVTQAGSLIDVSGAAPVRLDEVNAAGGIGRERASDAGQVALFAEESLLLDGAFAAQGGSPAQRAGTLEVGLSANARVTQADPANAPARTMLLSNAVAPQAAGLSPDAPLADSGEVRARLGTDALEAAGFDRLRFASRDGITLADGLNLGEGRSQPLAELQLDAARIETDQSNVTLRADAIRLGNFDQSGRTGTAGSSLNGGTLSAQGRLVELAGNVRLQGMASTELTGTEQVQLNAVKQPGGAGTPSGSIEHVARISTSGDLLLRGGVVSPNSFSDVQVDAIGRDVRIESVGNAPADALSVLGSLTINANNITQAGRLEAPLGQIELNATGDLVLAENSMTSVAGGAQTAPLGKIRNGTDWVVSLGESPAAQVEIERLPEKSVRLNGQNVLLQAGSEVNVSGGGDLQAYEFTVGPGGSRDILRDAGTFAILPGRTSSFAPADPQEPLDLSPGEAVYLAGVPGLADGTYTLLPAHYALLPGALAVRLSDATPLFPGQSYTRQDGVRVAAGYITDGRANAPRQGDWRSVQVLTRDQVQQRSEFTLTQASDFFEGSASLARDAGQLSLATLSRLELDGRVLGAAAGGGRGSTVDISAPELVIAGGSGVAPAMGANATQVQVDQLNVLGADSLFLGGTRVRNADATELQVQTNRLTLANDAASALRAPEVILAAQDTLRLGAEAAVETSGSLSDANQPVQRYETQGNGAALIASSRPVSFNRTGAPDRSAGTLLSETTSSVKSSKSIVLDATQNFGFVGQSEIRNDGLLSVGASRVSLGADSAPVGGVNFTQAELDNLGQLDELTLTSYSTVDLHGNVRVGSTDGSGQNTLKSLSVQAAGLAGVDNAGSTATLQADRVQLSNPQAVTAATASGGAGVLNVVTRQLVLGEGNKTLSGFDRIELQADEVVAQGQRGTTRLEAETRIATARLSGESGASQALEAGARRLDIASLAPSQALAPSGALGASWSASAGSLNFDTAAELPSGAMVLNATQGDLTLGENARIDVAGRSVAFFDVTRGTAGGDVTLVSDVGNVVLADDARINVSGAPGADGGTLSASATQGRLLLADQNLTGQTSEDALAQRGEGARVNIDVNVLDNASTLFSALQNSGLDGEVAVRARTGDVVVAAGDSVAANRVQISADAGSIRVAGGAVVAATADRRGDAGQVGLYAGESVVLENTARVSAATAATGGDGGRVALSAQRGTLDLRAGSVIDVSAGAGGEAGDVKLRALRQGNDVAVTALQSQIIGADRVDLEAVRVYNNINTLNATGDSTDTTLSLTTINENDDAFATNHAAIKSRLGQADDPRFHIVSGTEVRSQGNLNLGEDTAAPDWNLVNSAAGGEAGVLTLRAQGNVTVNSNLSDGFAVATPTTGSGNAARSAELQSAAVRGGESWSYRLVAGADAGAANPMQTSSSSTGDLTLAAGKLIRTGTGDIELAAAQDIRLASDSSVIYTAGRLNDPLENFVEPIARQRALFTHQGGDVSLSAGRNIEGAPSNQLYSQWLFRQGRLNTETGQYETGQGSLAWWVRFDQFRQGVGALGGGDVSVSAGNTVRNLSASAPTQGRMASATPDASRLVRTGGGNVTVEAGADVLSGQYYADNGSLRVVAGGQVASGYASGGAVYTVVALGDAQASVRARGDVNLQAVINPTLLPQSFSSTFSNRFLDLANVGSGTSATQGRPAERVSYFSTYGSDSGATLSSLNGNAVLQGGTGNTLGDGAAGLQRVFSSQFPATTVPTLNLLAPSLRATAFTGDVAVNGSGQGSTTLLPSATGRLEILAQGGVQLNDSLRQSDNDPAAVAGVLRPAQDVALLLAPTAAALNGAVPVHAGDSSTAKVYAVAGDVRGVSAAGAATGGLPATTLSVAQAIEVRAGRDITDFNLNIQHANSGDRSTVQAGRDVIYTSGAQRTDNDGVRVGGEGVLTVSAQRNINLGTSGGIVSRGDLDNPNLSPRGADLQVLAGVGGQGFDAAGSLQRLSERLSAGPISDTDLTLARWLTGDGTLTAEAAPAAVTALRELPAQAQSDRVREFIFTALRTTGRQANEAGSEFAGSFERGYAALELVFPGIGETDDQGRFTNYEGSLNLFASRIKTERGGNIDVLVPGGGLIVGLANTPANLVNVGNNVLGVVASQTGDIRAFTRDDMLVNQSRVLTVGGGDVLLWSSEGDIDAGKGAKTASAVPPPVIQVDAQGRVTQELLGAASGSGIGALSTNGITAGDVDLIAPKGTVNAGDAGIRAGNLNIAAQVVLGADNITVSGSSAGTPVADTSAVTAASSGATTGGDDTSKVVEALNQAAAESAKAAQEIAASLRPSVVRVDVLGYGE
ncbi:filamentous haemagglutinin family protein [Hydrogenophaga sp.]|uniref:filamentous haemagglutinin family protein n=1 Tax=Hydrogenophaga sp. TaxID=1904254 RepID=UPI0026357E89|nr:filamentous haemagglutinin family protein [Hydrogenophaga sp.]MDM7948578.1 filamentous hemagglutinin family protein [Hydrogenophaga sp.]